MFYKIKLILVVCIACMFTYCSKNATLKTNIKVKILAIERTKCCDIHIRSTINKLHENITEHGHCWSSFSNTPSLAIDSFSCMGPLEKKKDFVETITTNPTTLHIRPYVISNGCIIYGETKTID